MYRLHQILLFSVVNSLISFIFFHLEILLLFLHFSFIFFRNSCFLSYFFLLTASFFLLILHYNFSFLTLKLSIYSYHTFFFIFLHFYLSKLQKRHLQFSFPLFIYFFKNFFFIDILNLCLRE